MGKPVVSIALYIGEHMDNEQENQELDRAYREYAEVQQGLEKAAQEAVQQSMVQAEATLKMFNHFVARLFV